LGVVHPSLIDQAGIGVPARVAVEETILVGEQDQQIRLDQVGDQGGQGVVVAEAQLVGGNRVVLVDDRDDPQPQQGAQRERALR
jgi:hypothetical protein